MNWARIAAACAAALLAAGCTSGHPAPVAAPASPTSAQPAATTASSTRPATIASATSSPPTTTSSVPKLGATQTLNDTGSVIRFTVTNYKARPAGDNAELAPKADRIATITVKTCIDKTDTAGDAIILTWAPWTLAFADDATVEAVHAWSASDFLAPLYPNDDNRQVPVGDCRTGLIPFDIPASVTSDPVKVEYNAGGLLQWEW